MSTFRVGGQGWAVGQYLIPAGTLIDNAAGADPWSLIVQQYAPGLIPPDATPLTNGDL